MQVEHQFDPAGFDLHNVVEEKDPGVVDQNLDREVVLFAIGEQFAGGIGKREIAVERDDFNVILFLQLLSDLDDTLRFVADDDQRIAASGQLAGILQTYSRTGSGNQSPALRWGCDVAAHLRSNSRLISFWIQFGKFCTCLWQAISIEYIRAMQ